jgi:Porin subfamily
VSKAYAVDKIIGRRMARLRQMNPRIVLAAATALAIVVSPGIAQTLTQPTPAPSPSPPKVTTKSRPAEHVKTCDAYGPGFRNIPGTDACIKIGGGVTVDVGR